VFRRRRYDTGYAGKWHMPDAYPRDGIAGSRVLQHDRTQRQLAVDVDQATMNAARELPRSQA